MKHLVLLTSALLALSLGGVGCHHRVTVENTPQGRVAVYGVQIIDGTKAVTDAVKQFEANGTIPTAQAAQVVQTAVKIDTQGQRLADLLTIYDALAPHADKAGPLGEIQAKVGEIGRLVTVLLIPIADEQARTQVGQLVGTLNQTLLTLSVELAKGVH